MIAQFHFRNAIKSEKRQAEWSLTLGEDVTAFGETKFQESLPMNPAKAASLGFQLSDVLGAVAAGALQEADEARAAQSQAEAARDAAEAQTAEVTRLANAAVTEQMAIAAAATARADELVKEQTAIAEEAVSRANSVAADLQSLRATLAAAGVTFPDGASEAQPAE